MERRLVVESNTGAAQTWNRVQVVRVEAGCLRQMSELMEARRDILRLVVCDAINPGHQVSRKPPKLAVDPFAPNDRVDLRDSGEPGVPDGLRVVRPERPYEVWKRCIRDRREMGGRVARFALSASAALHERDSQSRSFEQVRRGHTGQAAPNDRDVHRQTPQQRRKLRRSTDFPVRRRVDRSHGHFLRRPPVRPVFGPE
jgi:hypothetical protein